MLCVLMLYDVVFLQTSVQQVGDLTRLVRGDTSSLARRLLAALITIDVHSRDIVSTLLSKGTRSTEEFEWQMQLRYYWHDDDLTVRQVRPCSL
jgi:dynein heavy chain